jgi:alkylation response protein AidB-like acyl-CoA dehydrogenase
MQVKGLDADGLAFKRSVEQIVGSVVAPLLAQVAEEPLAREHMQRLFTVLGKTGFFGTRVPEAHGGSGLPRVLAGVFLETIPAFLGVACASHEATAYRIYLGGPSEAREKYLPSLVNGELIAGTAISEPETGSDSNHPETVFAKTGDRLEIRGSKLWITNASVADLLMVFGRDETSGRLARLMVDARETEIRAREIPMTGLRRGHLCEVQIVGSVPAANLIGAESVGASNAMARSWTMNRVSMALLALAVARRAVDAAITYVKTRTQFGRPVGSFQLVQALIADALSSVEAGRLLCYRALSIMDDGDESMLWSSMAKLFGTEAALQAVIKAQQAVGTFGVSAESQFDEWYRDVRMFTFPDGTTQIQQLLIGREIIGLAAFK